MAKKIEADVLVTGDFVLDRHLYEGNRHHYGDQRSRGVKEVEQLGGAALIHYLLQALAGDGTSRFTVKVDADGNPFLPPGERVPPGLSAYAIWRPLELGDSKPPKKLVWRTKDRDAMGFGRTPENAKPFWWSPADDPPKHPKVVVVSDGGMGFRHKRGLWPSDTILGQAKWIVLKTAEPLCEGELWEHLTRKFNSKLVVVASAADLRKSAAQISTGLSWDATVESVLAALRPKGGLAGLTRCRHLVVAFGVEGGLWLDFKNQTAPEAHFVYDADEIEGDHRKLGEGTAFGALSCLAAAVAWYLLRHVLAKGAKEPPDLEAATECGLSGINSLLAEGHGPAAADGAGYPAKRLAGTIKQATCRYARAVFAASAVPSQDWNMTRHALRRPGRSRPEPAWALAELVAQRGRIAVDSLPHLSIRKLISADRQEVESLRILTQLILDYKKRKECKRPLAIGVFGPPGAGKSFAVREIAQALIGEKEWMEFNLSQFELGTEDMIGAFHQIRDRALAGQVPVAFFDEFDSRKYMWLQYLLGPMQDGLFQQGQITHPIGKCVFIFAGGTSWTFDSFGPPKTNAEAYAEFEMAKGPDFKSRLDGLLDIAGPNRRMITSVSRDGLSYKRTPDRSDIFFPVRRAFMVRAEFRCEPYERLAIDVGLLRGLLRVEKYTHGARSLSKVLEPLKAARPDMIYRSLLPPRQQLALHVDADGFLRECRRTAPTLPPAKLGTQVIETMAEVIHETWRRLGKEQGWLKPYNDVDFRKLSEFYKNSNREAAKRMADTLALIGLGIKPGKNTVREREAVRRKMEYHLEMLAEGEHAKWMEWYLDQGWEYSPQKPDEPVTQEPTVKKQPCLRPYVDLSDAERNKDRDSIRHYLDFAREADRRIVPK